MTDTGPRTAADGAPAAAARRDGTGIRPATAGRVRGIGRPPRIMGLDIARGLAVIGMAAAHMAGAPDLEWGVPSTWAGIVHGRPAILFALLAGVSTALITGRTRRPTRDEMPPLRSLLVRRGLTIFAFGLLLELLNTNIAVILCVYGVLFVCAIPFLRWRVRWLAVGAAGFAIIGPFLLAALHVLLFDPDGPGLNLAVFGTYPVPVWLAFMLAGMAIGRAEFAGARTAAGLLLIGAGLAVIAYIAGASVTAQLDRPTAAADASPSENADAAAVPVTIPPSRLADVDTSGMTCQTLPQQWVACQAPDAGTQDDSYRSRLEASDPVHTGLTEALAVSEHSGGVFEIIGSGGFAIAVLGLCLLLARPLRWLLLPIACLGMMPLTTYSVHVVIYWLAAGGPAGSFEASTALWAWSTFALIAAATAWTVVARRGPLERVVAAVARRGVQPAPPGIPPAERPIAEKPAAIPPAERPFPPTEDHPHGPSEK